MDTIITHTMTTANSVETWTRATGPARFAPYLLTTLWESHGTATLGRAAWSTAERLARPETNGTRFNRGYCAASYHEPKRPSAAAVATVLRAIDRAIARCDAPGDAL